MSNQERITTFLAGYVFFRRGNEVLLQRRFNTGYRDGYYGVPAGHIENGEFALAGTIREIEEEVGIQLAPEQLRLVTVMHRICGDHERVGFFFEAREWAGEPVNKEPEKCDELRWFAVDALPEQMVPNVRVALQRAEAGNVYAEFDERENKIF